MSYTITQPCCNDAACVDVCPTDCIHPRPDDPTFMQAEMLHIDAERCIDCDACRTACPVGAIHPTELLPPDLREYVAINAAYFAATRASSPTAPHHFGPLKAGEPAGSADTLRVAIVGAGPAGLYAAEHLLELEGIRCEVEVFDRLPTPHGLVRAGVAPDHQQTRLVEQVFRRIAARPGFRYHLNVEVGRDIGHDDLARHHHAVIYACGAPADRTLGIPGEELAGSHGAGRFVAWCNGHPDARDLSVDLATPRAVIVGNGNVALDVARILLGGAPRLARTDAADHALEALAGSAIDEVVVLGRRGPEHAAFTTPELLGLQDLGVHIDVQPRELQNVLADDPPKLALLRRMATAAPTPGCKRLVLRFFAAPEAMLGSDRVEGLRIIATPQAANPDEARTTSTIEVLETRLVIRAIGFEPSLDPGLPLHDPAGAVRHAHGRVLAATEDEPMRGVYATGWIKRGPSGSIGTNRVCARETVESLVADHRAGLLADPPGDAITLRELLASRCPGAVEHDGWRRIDLAEIDRGRQQGRSRSKLASWRELLDVAGTP